LFVIAVPEGMLAPLSILSDKSNAKNAGYLTLTVDLPHRPRTTGWKSQNHHLRGHEQQIAKGLGLTMTEVHETIKAELADWPERAVQGPKGERFIKLSEREISVEVCAAAIELCHAWAAHVGITLIEDEAGGELKGRGA
jgi:hypothetical protein